MDPCPFVRILIGNFAITSPATSLPSISDNLPTSSTSPYFCRIHLRDSDSHHHPHHFASVPIVPPNSDSYLPSVAAIFDLSKIQIEKLKTTKNPSLKISIYQSRQTPSCAFDTEKLLGKISVPFDLNIAELRSCVFQNGWVVIGGKNRASSASFEQLLHVTVRSEPDPRFVFRFDGEPECSPQVFQIQGSVKQPVFTCKFSFRDRSLSSRSSMSDSSNSKSWLPSSLTSQKDNSPERKGWSVTVHDLSGSPVAAASMITPFVPSPGTHLVSRSNPGAWLILRPGGCDGTWKPWGRLEAWRESNRPNEVGYRFEILPAVTAPVTLASSSVSSRYGGKFVIDVTSGVTPVNSPNGSWDLGSGSRSGSGSEFGLEPELLYRGFVMSVTVAGEGKCSKPEVEVGVPLVSCKEDAAAFVALAAAMDLCMDACMLFSQKLRKELRQ